MDLSFGKEQRLNHKREIEALFESGEVLFRYPYKVYFKQNTGKDVDCVMFSVPKKIFKRAYKRNLLKRRMREAYRHSRHLLDPVIKSDILFVYLSKDIYSYDQIVSRMEDVLGKICEASQKVGGCAVPAPDQVL